MKKKLLQSIQLFKVHSWKEINHNLYVYGEWLTGNFKHQSKSYFNIIGLEKNIQCKGYYKKEHIIFSENVKDICEQLYEKAIIEYQ